MVLVVSITAAIAEKTGDGIHAAGDQRLIVNIKGLVYLYTLLHA
jgi:hypothetical protein